MSEMDKSGQKVHQYLGYKVAETFSTCQKNRFWPFLVDTGRLALCHLVQLKDFLTSMFSLPSFKCSAVNLNQMKDDHALWHCVYCMCAAPASLWDRTSSRTEHMRLPIRCVYRLTAQQARVHVVRGARNTQTHSPRAVLQKPATLW